MKTRYDKSQTFGQIRLTPFRFSFKIVFAFDAAINNILHYFLIFSISEKYTKETLHVHTVKRKFKENGEKGLKD